MSFAPVQRSKVSDAVARTVRGAIVGGTYRPGDRLPAERVLAEQFGVNRSTVREAVHRLEAWGLVEVRQGEGTRVVDFLSTAGLQLLPFLIAPGGRLDPRLLRDLLDLRAELLAWTAARAADNPSAAGLEALEQMLDALESADSADRIQELDYGFFQLLVQLSGNKVLELVANAMERVYLENRQLFAALYQRVNGPMDTQHHRAATVRGFARWVAPPMLDAPRMSHMCPAPCARAPSCSRG